MDLDIVRRFLFLLMILWAKVFASEPVDVPGEQIYEMVYSPDHQQKAYVTIHNNQPQLDIANTNGSNQHIIFTSPHELEAIGIGISDIGWSPNGKQIIFVLTYFDQSNYGLAVSDIRIINADGSNLYILVDRNHWVFKPIWLLDGKHIVFNQGMGGCFATYVTEISGLNREYVTGCLGVG